jgi:hypothetical protein
MTKGRRLLKNINVLNIVLVSAVLLMARYTVAPSLHFNLGDIVSLQKKSAEEKEIKSAAANPPSPSDYVVIPEENLFHPERKIPPEKKADEKPLAKPEFVVYGTVITGDESIAYLEDLKSPVNTQGRGKRQITLKTGGVLSGYTLQSVEADKIVMVRGEEKMVIPVHDTSRTNPSVQPSTQKAAEPLVGTQSQPSRGSLVQQVPPPRRWAPVRTQSPLSPVRTQSQPSRGSLMQQAPLPGTRARMTPSEERARRFFQR